MAGLYETWKDKITGEVSYSCTMITNPANEMMAHIHNTRKRMPAFLNRENYQHWIDQEIALKDRLALISPVAEDFLKGQEIEIS